MLVQCTVGVPQSLHGIGRPGALLQLVSQDGVSAEPAPQTNAVASVESAVLRFCFSVETD